MKIKDATKFVAYLRVSTARQGRSGLGLEAQREAVQRFVAGRGGIIIAPEFVEVESGKKDDRPQLAAALKRCRLTGATLVVAKLDRLSRDAAFLMTLHKSSVEFIAADIPEANTLTVGIMALMAQQEREMISARTKAALAAAKARGTKLGGFREEAPNIRKFQRAATEANQERANEVAEEFREILQELMKQGVSLNEAARRLNLEGIETARGCKWTPMAVKRMVERLGV